jgi:hypothetical protein
MDTGRAATPNQATLPTPVARRQLSACRTMKASDSRNQKYGLDEQAVDIVEPASHVIDGR